MHNWFEKLKCDPKLEGRIIRAPMVATCIMNLHESWRSRVVSIMSYQALPTSRIAFLLYEQTRSSI